MLTLAKLGRSEIAWFGGKRGRLFLASWGSRCGGGWADPFGDFGAYKPKLGLFWGLVVKGLWWSGLYREQGGPGGQCWRAGWGGTCHWRFLPMKILFWNVQELESPHLPLSFRGWCSSNGWLYAYWWRPVWQERALRGSALLPDILGFLRYWVVQPCRWDYCCLKIEIRQHWYSTQL